jgi:hypothetical protein
MDSVELKNHMIEDCEMEMEQKSIVVSYWSQTSTKFLFCGKNVSKSLFGTGKIFRLFLIFRQQGRPDAILFENF